MSDTISELVALVPQWQDCQLSIQPLDGGITNRNFLVVVDTFKYVVRLPGTKTELLGINRGT